VTVSGRPARETKDLPARVRAWDAEDPLRGARARFEIPEGLIYLDGHSLGAMPTDAAARVASAAREEWGQGRVGSWKCHDWIGEPARIGAKIARLIGAEPDEVIVADSTSVNLFKLIGAVIAARGAQGVILGEAGDFPTDGYVAAGAVERHKGWRLKLRPAAEIAAALGEGADLLMLTHVSYRTGARHDLGELTARAHAAGALTLWDLSHSAGCLDLDLKGADADLAVGCGYKYLNGGPGAPAFLYVARRHQATLASPLPGWMGHAAPFAFEDAYAPASGVARFLCGTPPILSMLALEAAVDVFDGVDLALAEAKSQRLADLFIAEAEARCARFGLAPITPRESDRRGCHVAFRHPEAWPVMQALIERGVVGDVRAPDVIRFGLPALYLSFEDVWRATRALEDVLATGDWRVERHQARKTVTCGRA